MNDHKILLVDDEKSIVDMIKIALEKEGYKNIFTASTGIAAIETCKKVDPNLVVLDINLPDMDGFEVCKSLRKLTNAPIFFLTARTSDLDKLLGFGIGGDDYITKPFNPLEVAARIKAQFRRLELLSSKLPLEQQQVYDFGRFQLYEDSAQLVVDGKAIDCPAREFQLLLFLCKHPNKVYSKAQLYEQVWNDESINDDNTIMVHIRRLREKIEIDASNPKLLLTVRGLGYKLVFDK